MTEPGEWFPLLFVYCETLSCVSDVTNTMTGPFRVDNQTVHRWHFECLIQEVWKHAAYFGAAGLRRPQGLIVLVSVALETARMNIGVF